jgi:hypothetical protein
VRFGVHEGLSERDLDYAIVRIAEHLRALAAAGADGGDGAERRDACGTDRSVGHAGAGAAAGRTAGP